MHLIIKIIIVIAFFLYISHTSISTNPFSIHMDSWKTGVGVVLIIIGSILIALDVHRDAYKKGYEKCINDIENCYDSKS